MRPFAYFLVSRFLIVVVVENLLYFLRELRFQYFEADDNVGENNLIQRDKRRDTLVTSTNRTARKKVRAARLLAISRRGAHGWV